MSQRFNWTHCLRREARISKTCGRSTHVWHGPHRAYEKLFWIVCQATCRKITIFPISRLMRDVFALAANLLPFSDNTMQSIRIAQIIYTWRTPIEMFNRKNMPNKYACSFAEHICVCHPSWPKASFTRHSSELYKCLQRIRDDRHFVHLCAVPWAFCLQSNV